LAGLARRLVEEALAMRPVLISRTIVATADDGREYSSMEIDYCQTPEELEKALWLAAYSLDKRKIREYHILSGDLSFRVKNMLDA
jgi:hypothetical protein